MYSLGWLILQNKDAILALPEWAKTIMLIGIVWMFVSAVLNQLKGLLYLAVVVAIGYFAVTYFGIL